MNELWIFKDFLGKVYYQTLVFQESKKNSDSCSEVANRFVIETEKVVYYFVNLICIQTITRLLTRNIWLGC